MAFGIPAEDFHGGFGIPHFESRNNYNRPIYDDFDVQRQSDEWPQPPEEISPEEYDDWLQSIGVTPEEFEADMKAQDKWYNETFGEEVWSDFLEQMTYAND